MSNKYLPRGTKFIVPQNSNKKYTAIVPLKLKTIRVSFGDKRYEHYKDSVPKSLGGGKWSKKDHKDKSRRKNYRKRHGARFCNNGKRCINVKYSPAWFSYYFLW